MTTVNLISLRMDDSDPNNTYIELVYTVGDSKDPHYIPIKADLDIDMHHIEIDDVDCGLVCDALNKLISSKSQEIKNIIQKHVLGFDGDFKYSNEFKTFHGDFVVIKYWQPSDVHQNIAVVLEKRTDTCLRFDHPSLKFKSNSDYMDWYYSIDYKIENAIHSLKNQSKEAC